LPSAIRLKAYGRRLNGPDTASGATLLGFVHSFFEGEDSARSPLAAAGPVPPISTYNVFASPIEVPGRGLEPLRISPPDPKSGASANFATLAFQPIEQECAQFTPAPDSRNSLE